MHELLRAIHANPERDDLRQVYADQLLEAGDPRGEFIALQMLPRRTRAQGKRMTALLAAHRDAWIGPLRDALLVKTVRFERGFLARASLPRSPRGRSRQSIGHEAWATVEAIDAGFGWCWNAAAFVHPAMRSLHTIRGLKLQFAVEVLASPRPTALRCLGVDRVGVFDREPLDARTVRAAFETTPGAPELRHLTIGEVVAAEGLAWLLDSALGARLESLRLTEPSSRFWSTIPLRTPMFSGRGVRWLLARQRRPPVVTLDGEWLISLVGRHLRVSDGGRRRPSHAVLETLIRELHGAPLDSLEVVVHRPNLPRPSEHAALEAAVAASLPGVPARLPPPSDE